MTPISKLETLFLCTNFAAKTTYAVYISQLIINSIAVVDYYRYVTPVATTTQCSFSRIYHQRMGLVIITVVTCGTEST